MHSLNLYQITRKIIHLWFWEPNKSYFPSSMIKYCVLSNTLFCRLLSRKDWSIPWAFQRMSFRSLRTNQFVKFLISLPFISNSIYKSKSIKITNLHVHYTIIVKHRDHIHAIKPRNNHSTVKFNISYKLNNKLIQEIKPFT